MRKSKFKFEIWLPDLLDLKFSSGVSDNTKKLSATTKELILFLLGTSTFAGLNSLFQRAAVKAAWTTLFSVAFSTLKLSQSTSKIAV